MYTEGLCVPHTHKSTAVLESPLSLTRMPWDCGRKELRLCRHGKNIPTPQRSASGSQEMVSTDLSRANFFFPSTKHNHERWTVWYVNVWYFMLSSVYLQHQVAGILNLLRNNKRISQTASNPIRLNVSVRLTKAGLWLLSVSRLDKRKLLFFLNLAATGNKFIPNARGLIKGTHLVDY